MSDNPFSMPTAKEPPTEPATPPTRPRSLTRDEMIRSSAVGAASRLAAGATGLTQEEFWGNVHAIEHYIREGR